MSHQLIRFHCSLIIACLIVAAVNADTSEPRLQRLPSVEPAVWEQTVDGPIFHVPDIFNLPEFVLRFPQQNVTPVNFENEIDTSMDASNLETMDFFETTNVLNTTNEWPIFDRKTRMGWDPYAGCTRKGEITFKPGARLQPRYTYYNDNDSNDFFIGRFRLKGSGAIYDMGTYGMELRTDGTARLNSQQATGTTPVPAVENAWIDFILNPENMYLKVGLYDAPFSRDALTSDSKLLLIDRSLIRDSIARLGMADNTVGLMLHGRPEGGRFEYAFGLFENLIFEETRIRNSNGLMPAGRVAVFLLDPVQAGTHSVQIDGWGDYWGSYLAQGQRLSLGANVAGVSRVLQAVAPFGEFNAYAWGFDLFFNAGRFVFQAEYDWYCDDLNNGLQDLRGEGYFVQAGLMLSHCFELTTRYQRVDDAFNLTTPFSQADWTQVGLNYYFHNHNLKVQMDYTWKNERVGPEIANNGVQMQLQLDF